MRRRATLPFLFMLGLVFAIGMTPGLLAAQDGTQKLDFTDVTVRPLEGNGTAGKVNRDYNVTLLDGAYIPEAQYPEAMVIKVLDGVLAFRVLTDDVIVDPAGDVPTLLTASPPIPPGSDPHNGTPGRTFAASGSVQTCSGSPPNGLCLINQSVVGQDGDVFVELRPGYTVYLPSNTICFFCNVTGLDLKENKSPISSPGNQVVLLVWAPQANFSWLNGVGVPVPTPSASTQDLHDAVGWTVLRNPGSPCH